MPDPKGARRLVEIDCEVEFNKGILKVPVEVKSKEDLDSNNRPKIKKHKVWLIDIWMPRRFIDEFTDEKIKVDGDSVDVDELNQAYDDGLDDETNIENQGGKI